MFIFREKQVIYKDGAVGPVSGKKLAVSRDGNESSWFS